MTTVRRTLFYRFLGFCSYLQYSLLQPSLLAHRTGTLVCPEFPYFIFNRANIEYRVHLITFGFFYFVYRLFYLEAMTAAFVLFYLVHWCNTYVRRSTEFDSKKKKKNREPKLILYAFLFGCCIDRDQADAKAVIGCNQKQNRDTALSNNNCVQPKQ